MNNARPTNADATSRRPGLAARLFGPVMLQRLRRFRRIKRAYWSFWILLVLFGLSLPIEFFCNDKPLYVRFNGTSYFPIIQFYPQDEFLDNEIFTRVNYKDLNRSARFTDDDDNYMVFTLIPYGPQENIRAADIDIPDTVELEAQPLPKRGYIDIRANFTIRKAVSTELFFKIADRDLRRRPLDEVWELPANLRAGLEQRFANRPAPETRAKVLLGGRPVEAELSAFTPGDYPRKKFRINLTEVAEAADGIRVTFDRELQLVDGDEAAWNALPKPARAELRAIVQERFDTVIPPREILIGGDNYRVLAKKREISFPFGPAPGHPLGFDEAGRDVLVQILYAFRINMLFGLLLVLISKVIGVTIGAIQGYYGGWIDIGVQRFTEIWAALPFLYIMILIGSLYGRSFGILLFIYCIFHWIGISYYMRAEFLRLRQQPFVEAARVIGLPTRRILFRHILPNALVPLVTFVPFSLVGAIGILSALDYLGFGLPPLTPSWGILLKQAQKYSFAWWLVLYPALALFITMLLGVFIGEGVRAAFDPKKFSRME